VHDLQLSSCGPHPIALADAATAVRGYATARRWVFVRTPSHPAGTWVEAPAYPFQAFDAQPSDADPGSLTLSTLAAEGLHGVERDHQVRFAFHREIEELLPLVAGALDVAAGRPFWELPQGTAVESPVVDALAAARASSQPDRASAVLHHHRPALFPLLSPPTERAVGTHASARGTTPWAVVHDDLTRNAALFARLETLVSEDLGVRLTRLRLHDLLTWLVTTRRWADTVAQGHRP